MRYAVSFRSLRAELKCRAVCAVGFFHRDICVWSAISEAEAEELNKKSVAEEVLICLKLLPSTRTSPSFTCLRNRFAACGPDTWPRGKLGD